MTSNTILLLPTPDRLRALITSVAWGLCAEANPELDNPVIALPHHGDVGTGQAYIHWEPGILVNAGAEVRWELVERGVTYEGTFTVDDELAIDGEYPPGAALPVHLQRAKAIQGGRAAAFTLAESLERFLTEQLLITNSFVARELEGRDGDETETWAQTTNHGAVDGLGLDALATELIWGNDGAPDSVVLRMIRLAATTHINNQPLGSWFHRNLRARCEEAIRRHIGDPHVGRKIRRMVREKSPASVDELLAMYRRAHPRDSVGHDRIVAALSADKTLDAISQSLSSLVNPRTLSLDGAEESHNTEHTS